MVSAAVSRYCRRRHEPLAALYAAWLHEGRDPNPLFDTSFYLEKNPDVAQAGVNPLLHYSEYSWREGRDPHPDSIQQGT